MRIGIKDRLNEGRVGRVVLWLLGIPIPVLFIATASGSLLLTSLLPMSVAAPAANPPTPGSQPTNAANAVVGRPGFGQRFGMYGQLEEATKVLGTAIHVTNQPIARINDMVIDFESGRLLYVVAGFGTNNTNTTDQFAIAPAVLREQHGGQEHVLAFYTNKLSTAPKFEPDRTDDPGDVAFLTRVYQFYGVPAWWENPANQIPSQTGAPQGTTQPGAQPQPGAQAQPQAAQMQPPQTGSFIKARPISTLIGQTVTNNSQMPIGRLDDFIVDFRNERVPFVILTQTNTSHAVPPMAFIIGPDKQSVITGLDENTLQTAPPYTKGNVQMLANRGTALAIYQHFGKQPFFLFPGGLAPSGRPGGQPRVYPGTAPAPTPAPAPGTTPGATPPIK